MAVDLDNVRINVACPECGATVSSTFGVVKLTRVIGCDCGAIVNVDLDHSDVAAADHVLDEAEPHLGSNDDGLADNDDPDEPLTA